jgi:hypothetical protein
MIELWQQQCSQFANLDQSQKVLWLSKLLFVISMFARETYQVGTNDVDAPEDLRQFNELIHRASSYQLEIALGKAGGMPDEQFFMMLSDVVDELGVDATVVLEQIKQM